VHDAQAIGRETGSRRVSRRQRVETCTTHGSRCGFVGCDDDARRARSTCAGMATNAYPNNAHGTGSQDEFPPAGPGAYDQLRLAFERQVIWARDFAKVGDFASARDAREAADAICDELSDD
jgi:hypothetical protein